MGNPRYSTAARLEPKRLHYCSCNERVTATAAHQHEVGHKRAKDGHRFISFSAWNAARARSRL